MLIFLILLTSVVAIATFGFAGLMHLWWIIAPAAMVIIEIIDVIILLALV